MKREVKKEWIEGLRRVVLIDVGQGASWMSSECRNDGCECQRCYSSAKPFGPQSKAFSKPKKKLVMTTARDCAGSEERKLETTDRRSALLIINVDPHSCAAVKLGHSPQNRH